MKREEEYAKHIESLAREHGISIHWRRRSWSHFEAHVASRMVFVGPPTSLLRYLSALHEIGHIVDTWAHPLDEDDKKLSCEAAAWEWALAHALPGAIEATTPYVRERIADAWASYLPRR